MKSILAPGKHGFVHWLPVHGLVLLGVLGILPGPATGQTIRTRIEPFTGRQAFDSGLGTAFDGGLTAAGTQGIVGLRGGFDFTSYFGLHGFYWRGVSDDFDVWESPKAYGGEAQFRPVGFGWISPYVLAGYGRMLFAAEPDEHEHVRGEPIALPDHIDRSDDDRAALIVGGGLNVGMGGPLGLTASIRNYLLSDEGFSSPDRVSNWQLSAGLTLAWGGRSERYRRLADDPAPAPAPQIVVIPVGLPQGSTPEAGQPAIDPALAETLERIRQLLQTQGDILAAPVDSATAARMAQVVAAAVDSATAARSAAAPVAAVDQTDLAELEARLTRRLDALANRSSQQPTPPADPQEVTVTYEEVYESEPESRLDPSLRFPTRELRTFVAPQWGRGVQMAFGAAFEWKPSQSVTAFDVVPEFSVAIGQRKPTWMLASNLQYRTSWVIGGESFWINPVFACGVGFLRQDGYQLVANLSYGANIQLGRDRRGDRMPINLYVGHQGVDLFQRNRLIVGLSWDRGRDEDSPLN